jgi:Protein of unknown function (DUF3383)
MSTIPASVIVNVNPGVIGAGGAGLNLIGLFLTNNPRVPIGTVQSFSSPASVSSFFGATSQEAGLSQTYFNGDQNELSTPASVLFAQYPSQVVSAYLRGGNTSSISLAALQAFNGNLGVTIDGSLKTASINLAAATSFSNAAEIIGNSLGIQGAQVATFTGSIGAAGGTSSGSILTVSALSSGTIGAGDVVQGTGVTLGTYILSQLSGSIGGTGTYSVAQSQFALSAAMTAFAPAVTFDSVSSAFTINGTAGAASTITFGTGALATSLLLTQVTGAVLSQGAGVATPVAFMIALAQITQNWATFTTVFDPDAAVDPGGNTQKLAFAQWTNGQNNRYAYIAWDADASPTTTVPATASFGYLIGPNGFNYSGTSVWYDPTNEGVTAGIMGGIAQLNFNQINGRTDIAFMIFAGLLATVTNQQVAANLISNGYNYYGAFGTANANFIFAYNGAVSGPFAWLDSFVNQIWMNSQFQLQLLQLLIQVGSIPYNAAGFSLIETALSSIIQQAVAFGAIRVGVALSSSQITQINNQAGNVIAAQTVQNQGWYLQILPPSSAGRLARTSPTITFWYADGQSVQKITMASLEVQ